MKKKKKRNECIHTTFHNKKKQNKLQIHATTWVTLPSIMKSKRKPDIKEYILDPFT